MESTILCQGEVHISCKRKTVTILAFVVPMVSVSRQDIYEFGYDLVPIIFTETERAEFAEHHSRP